jgi:ribonuclease HI
MTGEMENNHQGLQPDLFGHIPSQEKAQEVSAVMHCDGASRGNPGKAGIGVVISLSGKGDHPGEPREYRISEHIGIATNNVAEYTALVRGLEKAVELGVRRIRIYLDSELLVRQINGIYKVKNKNLIRFWNRAMELLKEFDACKVSHVRRELNTDADSLARQGTKDRRP